MLERLAGPALHTLVLAHLSETNNNPRLAFQTTQDVLIDGSADKDVTLLVARQEQAGRVLDVA